MARAHANGLSLEFVEQGPAEGEVALLISGFGAQLTAWPDALCDAIAARGYRVVRFDNRDIGLSQRLDGVPALEGSELASRRALGLDLEGAYTLYDMASDAIGLLDWLDIKRAHIVGVSMGGMIAQLIAAGWPDRVRSLTSIITPSANPAIPLGNPDFSAIAVADTADDEAALDAQVRMYQALAGRVYALADVDQRAFLSRDAERCFYPEGVVRQGKAIGANHDRRDALARIRTPALVVHGELDPLIPLAASQDIAARIAGARLLVVSGMGHSIPAELADALAAAMTELFDEALLLPIQEG